MSETTSEPVAGEHINSPSAAELDAQIAADEAARHVPDTEPEAKADPEPAEVEPEVEAEEEIKHEDTEFEKRIARLAFEAREQRKIAKAATEELARLRGQAPPLPQDQELDARVEARARQIATEQAYNATAQAIYDQGVKEFGTDFDKKLANFGAAGIAISPEFIEAASAAGDAHKIFHYLGRNIDEAERIAGLPPHRMGVELAKIAAKPATVKAQSKAPAPIKPISGKAKAEQSDDEMDIGEYMRREDEKMWNRRR